MKIGEHSLRDHLRLLTPFFGLITAVWVLRLVMGLAHTPVELTRLVSVNVAGAVAVLGAAFLIHFKRFGSYANVVAAAFLLVVYGQVLIALSVAFSALTGIATIYTAPEFGGRMSHATHILGHLTLGVGTNLILGAADGSLILWLLRLFVPVTVKGTTPLR